VLSFDGYPQNAFAPVKAMLKNNPRLTVYVLHDASVTGCLLAHKLASDTGWFRGTARVVEVGIRPAHARNLRGMWRESMLGRVTDPKLTRAEQAWLSRYSADLATIRPEQVIKRLFAAIASEAELQAASKFVEVDEGGDFLVNSWSLGSDAAASDGGGDSFG
jgi:hypothetical protein